MKAAEYIRTIAGQPDNSLILAQVDAVNGNTCDVSPLDGSAPYKKVRLHTADASQGGFWHTPKVGSVVLIAEINKTDAAVVMYSEIEQSEIKIGDTTAVINDEVIVINGGDKGGLVNINELKAELNKSKARIDAIIQILKTTITSVSLQPNPAWLTTIEPILNLLQSEDYTGFENTKIKHG